MTLNVTRSGTGRPDIVFLHGLFGQGKNFTTIAKALRPATSLLVDLPNHGRSSRQPLVDYDAMAGEVADLLSSAGATEDPVTLVGHSMGGKVAMRVALRRPALVARLVVVDISPVGHPPYEGFEGYVDSMAAIDLASLRERREADAQLAAAVSNPATRAFLLQSLHYDLDAGRWEWLLNLPVLRAGLAAIAGWPDWQGPAYPGPVLWVAGSESDYVLPEHMAAMRVLFPRVRKVTVKGAGHWVHSDRPEVFSEVLRRFTGR